MPSRTVTIINAKGLHARASAKFVKLAETFDADVAVEKDGVSVLGSSIMGLMMLAVACGDQITINASGSDADDALRKLDGLIGAGFHETD